MSTCEDFLLVNWKVLGDLVSWSVFSDVSRHLKPWYQHPPPPLSYWWDTFTACRTTQRLFSAAVKTENELSYQNGLMAAAKVLTDRWDSSPSSLRRSLFVFRFTHWSLRFNEEMLKMLLVLLTAVNWTNKTLRPKWPSYSGDFYGGFILESQHTNSDQEGHPHWTHTLSFCLGLHCKQICRRFHGDRRFCVS